jgi:serine protease Do
MQRSRRLASREGAFVIGVRGGGPAATAEPALQGGDIILSINSQPVASLEDLVERYRTISSTTPLPEFVTLTFDRNGKNNITLIKPRPPKVDDPPRELPRAWIGVATQPVLRDLARQIGLGDTTGFRVTRVYPGTLAQQAGVQVGDIITAINGDALSPRTMQDMGMFQRRVRQLRAGETATLTVIRGSSPTTLAVTLERTRLAPDEALRDQNRDFGLSVRELTFFDQDDNRWDENTRGVVVTDVDPAGWAGMAGIMPGDLIQRVGETAVTDLTGYRSAMAAVSAQQPARVTFVLLRGTRTQFVFAEPDWKPIVTEEGAKR